MLQEVQLIFKLKEKKKRRKKGKGTLQFRTLCIHFSALVFEIALGGGGRG